MIKHFRNPGEDKTLLTGFILLGISFLLFAATMDSESVSWDVFSQTFLVIYSLFFVYFIILLIHNKKQYGKIWRFKSLSHNLLLLQLGNLSAYTLNRTIPVFQISTDWLVHYLLIYNLALLFFILRKDKRVDSINLSILLIVASGIVFQLYEVIYLIPYYTIGVMAFWFFGIALHAFIPIWHLIAAIKVTSQYLQASDRYKPVFALGITIPIIIIALVSLRWAIIENRISDNFHQQHQAVGEQELPNWVSVSQDLPQDWITKRILKSDLVYQVSNVDEFNWFPNEGIMNERRQHDPLVVIASFFGGKLKNLTIQDRLALLRAMFDQRHQTEPKLWRGDNLKTTDIVTNVQLFPAYRVAYTEKTIKIHNSLRVDRWRTTQEALYTFHLPEGSVVTSAALWIEGEERPAYLTTKEKADSAYTTVVGYERRDPLLVHWQEGNRVTVRIFPCRPAEDRQFKIGITSPLQYTQDGQLTYHNIDFIGPNWQHAKESINIVGDALPGDLDANLNWKQEGSMLTYEGAYKSDWEMTFKAPALSTTPFNFNGKSYQLTEIPAAITGFSPQEIYLDINQRWPKRALNKLWEEIKSKQVFVYTDHLEQVTETNHRALFKQLRKRNYGLFPLHKIKQPTQALVITSSGSNTPTLDDLKGSQFATGLNAFMQKDQRPVKVFHLGVDLSAYWKSLRELRLIDYNFGDSEDLNLLLEKQTFRTAPEAEQLLSNAYAGVSIQLIASGQELPKTEAPDHLMRLFVYNDLMRKIGTAYFDRETMESELIDMAKEAYVLSPISSLIVLETQADYERFGIEKSINSLENASISLSGSVPEPHEWLLIVLSLMVAAWLMLKSR